MSQGVLTGTSWGTNGCYDSWSNRHRSGMSGGGAGSARRRSRGVMYLHKGGQRAVKIISVPQCAVSTPSLQGQCPRHPSHPCSVAPLSVTAPSESVPRLLCRRVRARGVTRTRSVPLLANPSSLSGRAFQNRPRPGRRSSARFERRPGHLGGGHEARNERYVSDGRRTVRNKLPTPTSTRPLKTNSCLPEQQECLSYVPLVVSVARILQRPQHPLLAMPYARGITQRSGTTSCIVNVKRQPSCCKTDDTDGRTNGTPP